MTNQIVRWASLGLLLAGCAGAPVPARKMAAAQAAIRASEEAGAQAQPQARLQIRIAEEELRSARVLIRRGDNERAEHLLAKAEVDAELARSIARQDQAHAEAQRAQNLLRGIRGGR